MANRRFQGGAAGEFGNRPPHPPGGRGYDNGINSLRAMQPPILPPSHLPNRSLMDDESTIDNSTVHGSQGGSAMGYGAGRGGASGSGSGSGAGGGGSRGGGKEQYVRIMHSYLSQESHNPLTKRAAASVIVDATSSGNGRGGPGPRAQEAPAYDSESGEGEGGGGGEGGGNDRAPRLRSLADTNSAMDNSYLDNESTVSSLSSGSGRRAAYRSLVHFLPSLLPPPSSYGYQPHDQIEGLDKVDVANVDANANANVNAKSITGADGRNTGDGSSSDRIETDSWEQAPPGHPSHDDTGNNPAAGDGSNGNRAGGFHPSPPYPRQPHEQEATDAAREVLERSWEKRGMPTKGGDEEGGSPGRSLEAGEARSGEKGKLGGVASRVALFETSNGGSPSPPLMPQSRPNAGRVTSKGLVSTSPAPSTTIEEQERREEGMRAADVELRQSPLQLESTLKSVFRQPTSGNRVRWISNDIRNVQQFYEHLPPSGKALFPARSGNSSRSRASAALKQRHIASGPSPRSNPTSPTLASASQDDHHDAHDVRMIKTAEEEMGHASLSRRDEESLENNYSQTIDHHRELDGPPPADDTTSDTGYLYTEGIRDGAVRDDDSFSICMADVELVGAKELSLALTQSIETIIDPEALVMAALSDSIRALESQAKRQRGVDFLSRRAELGHSARSRRGEQLREIDDIMEDVVLCQEIALDKLAIGDYDGSMSEFMDVITKCEGGVYLFDDERVQDQLTGTIMHNIAVLHMRLGIFDICPALWDEAVLTRRDADPELGIFQLDVATSLNEMGIALFACGQFDKAVRAFADAIYIHQEVGESNGDGLAAAINNIGLAHFAMDSFDKALDAFDESLQMYRVAMMSRSDEDANGLVENEDDDGALAQSLLLGISTALCNVAYVHSVQGANQNAKESLGEALEIQEAVLGADDPRIKASLSLLAQISGQSYSQGFDRHSVSSFSEDPKTQNPFRDHSGEGFGSDDRVSDFDPFGDDGGDGAVSPARHEYR